MALSAILAIDHVKMLKIYKTRWFAKWAKKESLSDQALKQAVLEIKNDIVDANLGGFIYKKRIASSGQGKRSGFRTIIAYSSGAHCFFIYGFAKNKKENISSKELKAFKRLADELLNYSCDQITQAFESHEIYEVTADEKNYT